MLRLLQAEVSTQVSKRVRFRIAKPQNWIIGNSPFHGLLKGRLRMQVSRCFDDI